MRRLLLLVSFAAACHSYRPHRPPVLRPSVIKSQLTSSGNVTVLASDPPTREGGVAISPADTRIVVAAAIEFSTGGPIVRAFHSSNGGQTWARSSELPVSVGARLLSQSWDPVIAFDRTGAAYLTVIGAIGSSTWTVVVYRSTDQGATWTGVDLTPNAGRNDKPWIAIDNSGGPLDGSIYVVWHELSSTGGIRFSRSRDGGATWSPPKGFATDGWPFIAVSPNGKIYLSFVVTGQFSYGVASSTDGGDTFSAQSVIAPMRPANGDIPGTTAHQIAADRNNVYAIFPSSNTAGPAREAVVFERSTDGGATWSTPKVFSADNADAALPSMTVDPSTGELVLSWLDRRADPTTKDVRVFATRSVDGGITFDTPSAFTPPFGVTSFTGDYNQLSAQSGKRVAVFADGAGTFAAAPLEFDPKPPLTVPGKRRAVRH